MRYKPLFHGRLLSRGLTQGADGLDIYEAACIALADLEDRYSATEMTMHREGRDEMLAKIGLHQAPTQGTPGDGTVDLGTFKAPPAVDPEAELAEMRAQMKAKAAE